MNFTEIIKTIFMITLPFIQKLIESKVVPTLKRKTYEKVDTKVDILIEDLAQNASKISAEENEVKRLAYIEGTKLGVDTLRAIAEKLTKAADEIAKVLQKGGILWLAKAKRKKGADSKVGRNPHSLRSVMKYDLLDKQTEFMSIPHNQELDIAIYQGGYGSGKTWCGSLLGI